MVNKSILLFFLIVGCGNQVTLKENKLENLDALSSNTNTSYKKFGTLRKGTPSQVIIDGKTYLVSVYSSKSAMDFINALPLGTQLSITFTGGIQSNQVVLETIERR